MYPFVLILVVATILNPDRLTGLNQAVYVMECLVNGQNEEHIASTLNDDRQLVNMWMSFLRHNKWITFEGSQWSMTAKGAEWLRSRTLPTV